MRKKTNAFFEMAGGERGSDKQMILVEKENAIVPNNSDDAERMKILLSEKRLTIKMEPN